MILKICRSQKVSCSIGTTVRVSKLLTNHPVRKRNLEKTSAKNIERIKSMLQAFALARPSIRFSLKVLKCPDDKGNWACTPKHDATLADTALFVLGPAASSQCVLQIWDSSNARLRGRETSEAEHFIFAAFMPMQDCGRLHETPCGCPLTLLRHQSGRKRWAIHLH